MRDAAHEAERAVGAAAGTDGHGSGEVRGGIGGGGGAAAADAGALDPAARLAQAQALLADLAAARSRLAAELAGERSTGGSAPPADTWADAFEVSGRAGGAFEVSGRGAPGGAFEVSGRAASPSARFEVSGRAEPSAWVMADDCEC